MNAPALEIRGLRSGYAESVVVRGVDLAVQPGEIVALLGKNGMGKSTLLKTVMGFLPVVAGSVKCFGKDITGSPPYRIARLSVAYTPQEQTLFQDLTVQENLRLALSDDALMGPGLERIGGYFPFVPQRLKQRAGTLSGGEQKMLLVARALMSKPKLILIDEITEGLQPSVIERLANVLKAEREHSGTAILLIEQHVRFALAVADRYAVLKLGEIADQGEVVEPGVQARIGNQLAV